MVTAKRDVALCKLPREWLFFFVFTHGTSGCNRKKGGGSIRFVGDRMPPTQTSLQGGSSINSNSVSFHEEISNGRGFVWRLPGQNKGFPCIPGLIIRRNTTPHVQFRGPREFMVDFYGRLFGHHEHQLFFLIELEEPVRKIM